MRPTKFASCTVIHVPHASTVIPDDVRDQFLLADDELEREVRLMTDHFTDELFAVANDRALTVRFPVSRLVVDPERFESDSKEPMAALGMGVIYTRTSPLTLLRGALGDDDRRRLLDRWYRPHHTALTSAVAAALDAHGECLILDAHSFPPTPLPYERDQEQAHRLNICLGTDEFHTPQELTDRAIALCQEEGWTVSINRPFAGALVPMPYYEKDTRVRSLMIEVNRGLYLNEQCGTLSRGFPECRARLERILRRLTKAIR